MIYQKWLFDHQEIIEKARTPQKTIDYKLVGSNLLPENFTMKDLQNLYENHTRREIQKK